MCNRICRIFNRVQVVHRRVLQGWCSSSVTEFVMCVDAQFSRIFLSDAAWPCEGTLIAFVKIAGKTLLHKEFRGISVRFAGVLRDLCDLRSCC
jgi:hypothetical protein